MKAILVGELRVSSLHQGDIHMARFDLQNPGCWRDAISRSGWRAARLARQLDVSRRQLQRYTRAMFHQSPQDWLDEQRLKVAGDQLQKLRSAKRVAYELGFKQLSHFSREFKRFHGLSPREFLACSDLQARTASNHRQWPY
ncbi:MAG TPA: helix-turn-helix domain-containing protein [Verrucomicrobiae bacterium]|nr:helix-turn-helix domain-containing protein [Verrucomicrobiae bacterium]